VTTHTGPGYWKITNAHYDYALVDGKWRRKKNTLNTKGVYRNKPWLAVWVSDNPYSDRKPMRFKTHKAALGYALLGGTSLAPETLASLEER
jgi:hypothetical protein